MTHRAKYCIVYLYLLTCYQPCFGCFGNQQKNAHGLGCMLGILAEEVGESTGIHPFPATDISTPNPLHLRTFQPLHPSSTSNITKVKKESSFPHDFFHGKEPRTSRFLAISPDPPLPPRPKCRCPLNHTRRRSGRTFKMQCQQFRLKKHDASRGMVV